MLLGGAFAPFRYEIIILLLFLLFTEVWVHCRQPLSAAQSQELMKRGGQLTLSLGGTMRLVPASRSPLAVPAATGQPDAEG